MSSINTDDLVGLGDDAYVVPVNFMVTEDGPSFNCTFPDNVGLFSHPGSNEEFTTGLGVVIANLFVTRSVERVKPRARLLEGKVLVLSVKE